MKANPMVAWFWKNIVSKKDQRRINKQAKPDCVRSVVNLQYIDDGDIYHQLNIYYPIGVEGKLPVIFDVHGGGWYYGDKELNGNYCMSLASFGFAVVDISYRLVPQTDIFGQVKDCFAALNYVGEHADEYGLDMDKLCITGDSAGGHLIGLMANIVNDTMLQERFAVHTQFAFKAAGFTCPALNPPQMMGGRKIVDKYLDAVFGNGYRKTDIKNLISFSHIVNEKICPSFFISAYGDFLKEQTKQGFELVKKLGVDAQLCYFDKRVTKGHSLAHVFNVMHWDWEESLEANGQMCDFFKRYI